MMWWCADAVFLAGKSGRCQACILSMMNWLWQSLGSQISVYRGIQMQGCCGWHGPVRRAGELHTSSQFLPWKCQKSYFSAPKANQMKQCHPDCDKPALVVSFSAQLQMAGPSLQEANQRLAFGWERMQGMPGFLILCTGAKKKSLR